MKTKSLVLGITFFVVGMAFAFGIGARTAHHTFSHHAGVRKIAVIEVGAPLTVKELKLAGLF